MFQFTGTNEPNGNHGNYQLVFNQGNPVQINVYNYPLASNLQHVALGLGDVVYESGGQIDYIYFPTTAVVSLLYITADGSTTEVGLSGNDGVVGIALFLGGDTAPNRALVQIARMAIISIRQTVRRQK